MFSRLSIVPSLLFLALFLALPACMDFDEPLETDESMDAVVNGTPVVGYPSTGGLLRGTSPDGAFMQCTGTLVGCDTFITAAHCVCEDPTVCNTPIPPSQLYAYFQNAGTYPVASVAIEPAYSFPSFGDIAVVRLAEPVVGITPTPIIRDNPALNAQMTIVGYGLTVKGLTDSGIKREGVLQRSACNGFPDTTHLCFNPTNSPSVSCSGDSGGPNFIDIGGVRHLGGVVSGGGTPDSCSDRQKFATNVAGFTSFIESNAGTLGGTCGPLPAADDPATVLRTAEGTGGAANSYTIDVPAQATELRVAVNAIFGSTDLYVKFNGPASREDHDCWQRGSQTSYCQMKSPQAGTWHASVESPNTFQVAMTALGGGPGGLGDAFETTNDELLEVAADEGVLLNDSGSLGLGLTAELVSGPASGGLNLGAAGDFTYLANPDFTGMDSFTYLVRDGEYASKAITVTIEVSEPGGCGCASSGSRGSGGLAVLFIAMFFAGARRRRL